MLGLDQALLRFYHEPTRGVSGRQMFLACVRLSVLVMVLAGAVASVFFAPPLAVAFGLGQGGAALVPFLFLNAALYMLVRYVNVLLRLENDVRAYTVQTLWMNACLNLIYLLPGFFTSNTWAFIGAALAGFGGVAIAFWFKASDLDYSWMIGDKDWSSGANPGFGVCCYKSYNNANRFYSSFADNSRNRTEQQTTNTLNYINDGQWHHIVATLDRDGDSLLYVDGQQVASAATNPASTGDATSSLPFCIGADSKGNYRTKAQYDEVKVYHEALTPEQVVLAAQLPHTHQATQVEEKAATCTQDGNIAYWYCADCGKYFSDEACTVEITLEDTVVPATGHHYENGVCVDCGEKEPSQGQANKTL